MTIQETREVISNRLNKVAYHLEDGLGPNGLLGPYTEEQADAVRGLVDDLDYVLNWLEAQPDAPEPDWTQAPPWAQWWAVDANGMAWWYATQPEYLSGDGTDWDCGQQSRRVGEIDLPLGIDWRTTLRRRLAHDTQAQTGGGNVVNIPEDIRQAILICCSWAELYGHKVEEDAAYAVMEWLEAQPDAPEPDWTQAPPWAQWWAVDANGMAWWYATQPEYLSGDGTDWWYATQPEYLSGDGTDWDCGQQSRFVGEIDLPLGVDWRTTLRRRAEAQP